MFSRFIQIVDWNAHPVKKGSVGIAGSVSAWLSTHLHMLDGLIKGIAFYGGAVVVVLTIISLSIDLYRKLKK